MCEISHLNENMNFDDVETMCVFDWYPRMRRLRYLSTFFFQPVPRKQVTLTWCIALTIYSSIGERCELSSKQRLIRRSRTNKHQGPANRMFRSHKKCKLVNQNRCIGLPMALVTCTTMLRWRSSTRTAERHLFPDSTDLDGYFTPAS